MPDMAFFRTFTRQQIHLLASGYNHDTLFQWDGHDIIRRVLELAPGHDPLDGRARLTLEGAHGPPRTCHRPGLPACMDHLRYSCARLYLAGDPLGWIRLS